MSITTWSNLFQHYKEHYDFTLRKITYQELYEIQEKAESEEWVPER